MTQPPIEDHLILNVEAHTESGHSILAKFIIGADGKNSTVRSMANIHLEVQVKGHTGQLADITLKHPIDSSKGMFWCFSPEGNANHPSHHSHIHRDGHLMRNRSERLHSVVQSTSPSRENGKTHQEGR